MGKEAPVESGAKTSDQVFEIRYRPNARILDRRGEWAVELSSQLKLPTWQVGPNRIDLSNSTSEHRAFVSFSGSAQESEEVSFIRRFAENEEFGFEHCQPLRF